MGTLARYAMAVAFPVSLRQVPWSTLVVNLLGSFLIGIVMFLIVERTFSLLIRPFLVIGVLGGFTTYSTFAVETVQLSRERPLIALIYVVISYIGGILCVLAGGAVIGQIVTRSIDRKPASS